MWLSTLLIMGEMNVIETPLVPGVIVWWCRTWLLKMVLIQTCSHCCFPPLVHAVQLEEWTSQSDSYWVSQWEQQGSVLPAVWREEDRQWTEGQHHQGKRAWMWSPFLVELGGNGSFQWPLCGTCVLSRLLWLRWDSRMTLEWTF